MKKSLWTIISLTTFLLVVAVIVPRIVFGAGEAPTVSLSGDDKFADGGTNDAYDALVILDVNTETSNFNSYAMDYSYDQQNWTAFSAQYKNLGTNHRQYYWSTSSLNNDTVYVRVAYDYGDPSAVSSYTVTEFNIKHETSGRRGSYLVEDFTGTIWKDNAQSTNVTWPQTGAVRLTGGSSGIAYSSNLAPTTGGAVLSIAVQPIMSDYATDQQIKFQISNDGTNWYGESGINTYLTFTGATPNEKTIALPASDATDNKVIWRALFAKGGLSPALPEIFKLRLQWEVNGVPIPCFTINPQVSSDPNQSFYFNASCSSDYSPGMGLTYAWSWDEGVNVTSYTSAVDTMHIFGTTSSSTVWVYVKDSYGSFATTSDIVNTPGVQDSIYGWAWNINYGWTSLNCDNVYYGESIDLCNNSTYKVLMNADKTISGWAWNGNLGWMCFGASCSAYGLTPDGTAPIARYSMSTGEITGWGKYIVYQDMPEQGWMKFKGDKINGNSWCGADGKSCVHLNFSINGMSGWAWGGAVDPSNGVVGAGWENYMGIINAPWFETKFSSIYGLKKMGSENQFSAPDGKYSATYCIWTDPKGGDGSITNLSSQFSCIKPSYDGNEKFPSMNNKYSSVDGLLNFATMIQSAEDSGTVYTSNDVDAILNASRPLAGNVYYFHNSVSDYTIDQALTFFNGRNKNSSAAGTIVIDGNLYINSSLRYESSAVQYSSKNLASVAFIVKGDIIVNPSVDTISGVFVALGKEGQQSCAVASEGCGRFVTGDDSSSARRLNINGLVIARKFVLQRTYKQNSKSAESFNYDGRVSINTPPGLSNIAGGLPVWRESLAGQN